MSAGPTQDQQLAQVLVEFAHTLGTDFSVQRILDHLVQRIVDILPVTGAGVMLARDGEEMHFVAASDDVITSIEGLQNELHEGPCWEAYLTGEAVCVENLSTDTDFPRFSPRAREQGLAAMFTFPMRLDAARLGAVDLYRDVPGPLGEWDLQAAQVLADVAAAYLYNAQSRIDVSATLAQLSHRSLHDPLTGLANRTLFEEMLERAVARARRSHSLAAVLFVDLDRFKGVNDRHGHHVGDELLAAVAQRLHGALRPGDCLARLGGDEFVALCEDLEGPGAGERIADRVLALMSAPFHVAGRTLSVSASVGVAFSGPGQDIPQELLRDADFAMYEAKNNGGGRRALVVAGSRLAADRRQDLEDELAQAQAREQLGLVYQPIIDLRTSRPRAVEALLRWNHPERGEVQPAVIVPSAERTGLIGPLGEWILREACRTARLRQRDRPELEVMVNVSAHQLMGPAFLSVLERVLADSGVPPASLFLEITESVLLTDASRALSLLREIKQLGVRLSLDDFGTGYSSLAYLRQFPFDIVKIDRSFTADLLHDEVTRSIVRAMIDLGHVLDLTVTAEGVETASELDAVIDMGADHAQGFYLSRPVPGPDLVLDVSPALAARQLTT
ncbi:MAG TPA: GGDEF domain-containing protein [Mycobacteriales bacterium]|jgi:diguanylate cyclase (GGDEF)-like protein|nr:GGDEF domain-containing protein [Mycobacteriales bacterium]